VELLEHWWNTFIGGMARRDVFLRANPAGLYEVELRQHGRSTYREYPTEADARTVVEQLIGQGTWKRLDQLSRPH
jgi:hypothetical protein